MSKDSATLAWEPPENDGGNEIRGYNLERKETNSLLWTQITKVYSNLLLLIKFLFIILIYIYAFSSLQNLVKRREYFDTGLIEGLEYQFRIQANNTAGLGPFCTPTSPAVARDPCGIYTRSIYLFRILQTCIPQSRTKYQLHL